MNVELGDFVGCGCSGIFEVHGNVDGFAGLDLGVAQLEIGKGELGIAETVAERIQRSAFSLPKSKSWPSWPVFLPVSFV